MDNFYYLSEMLYSTNLHIRKIIILNYLFIFRFSRRHSSDFSSFLITAFTNTHIKFDFYEQIIQY